MYSCTLQVFADSVAPTKPKQEDAWKKQRAAFNQVFFCFSKQECSYRAGVYKRELFDKPLGHTVQAKAIEEMKKMNLTWYNIGPNYYKFYDPEPNDKEISISYFKKGFASHIIPKYEFTINYNEN